MNKLTRATRTAGLAAALALLGGLTASAMSYGPLTASHGGSAQGLGYGSFVATGYNGAKLTSTLADLHKDGTRTYTSAKGYGSGDYVGVQSGRRSDGGTAYARMYDRTGQAARSTRGFTGYVQVCQDVNLRADWCSTKKSGRM